MKALDQVLPCFDCGSVNRKPGPDDDALAACFKKQADPDMFEEEVKSGSAAKRRVEPDDAYLVASVAKKQATSYAETIGHNVEDEEEVDMDLIDNESPFIEFRYISTFGRKIGGFLFKNCEAGNGNSDELNCRKVFVEAVFRRDGRPLVACMI
ncbi:violaxanthin de-epoxidase [Striga asiatica]|uniref:Violaxanthin de-epoxidase n=1 Tax=Striga asiatica TaxID=4170 RepID=A0A5A7RJS3_STRAF|nr:violaxanthin de-epoxidase [Striga asiatica]